MLFGLVSVRCLLPCCVRGGKLYLSGSCLSRVSAFSAVPTTKCWVYLLEAVPAYVFTYCGCEEFNKSNT